MKADTAAVKAKIEEVTALSAKTFVSVAPRSNGVLPTAPYVVIHPADGTDTQERVTGPRSTRHPSFTFHIVGTSYDNAQTVTEQIKAKFITGGVGIRLTVTGWNTKPCKWSSPLPTQVDNSITPSLIYNVVELDYDAEPAA